jgi:hypothetical protein
VSEELDLRVSDAERERVAVSLREHCAAGRLTLEKPGASRRGISGADGG